MKINKLIGLGLILLCGLVSCVDDKYDFDNIDATIELETDLVAPLAYSTVKVMDLLGSDSLKGMQIELKGDTMYIVKRDSQHMGNELINQLKVLPSGRFDLEVPLSLISEFEDKYADFNHDFDIEFNVNTNENERLDSILMGRSNIDINISFPKRMLEGSYIQLNFNPAELELNPNLYPGNFIRINLENVTEEHPYVNEKINLYGAVLKLCGKGKITFNVEGEVFTEEEMSLLNIFAIHMDCTHMIPHLTYLNIRNKRDIVERVKEIDFGYTEDFYFSDAFLPFYDPAIFMTCHNNIGVPARYYLDYVEGECSATGEVVKADFGGDNPDTTSIYIESPIYEEIKGMSREELLNFNVDKLTKNSHLTLNREFGRTDRLFKIKVDKLRYKYRIRSVEEDRSNVHFFFQNSYMELTEVTELPLWFEGDSEDMDKNFYFHRTDTMAINSEAIELNGIEISEDTKGVLKFNYKNHFPVGVKANLKFIDEYGYEVMKSCAQEFLIEAAEVDENGAVISPVVPEEMLMLSLTYKQLNELLTKVKNIVIDYRLENEKHKNVMLESTDWLDVKVMFHIAGGVVMNPQDM